MSLTWRDAVATLLVAAVVTITYAKLKGFEWPMLTSWRMATLAIFVIGIATCIVVGSGSTTLAQGIWASIAAILGVVAFGLVVGGLIFDSRTIFLLLSADIVALWLVATIHHVVT